MHTRAEHTGAKLLTTYKGALLADEKELYFNYIGLWVDCARLLTTMHHAIGPSLPIPTPHILVFVSALFHDAEYHLSVKQLINKTCFALTSELLQKHMKASGHTYAQAAAANASKRGWAQAGGPEASKITGVDGKVEDQRENVVVPELGKAPNVNASSASAQESVGSSKEVPDVKDVFAARKKRGRRLLRSRK